MKILKTMSFLTLMALSISALLEESNAQSGCEVGYYCPPGSYLTTCQGCTSGGEGTSVSCHTCAMNGGGSKRDSSGGPCSNPNMDISNCNGDLVCGPCPSSASIKHGKRI